MIFVDDLPAPVPGGRAGACNRAIHLLQGRSLDARDDGIECLEVATADNPDSVNDALLFVMVCATDIDLDDRLSACSGTANSGQLCCIPSGAGCSSEIPGAGYSARILGAGYSARVLGAGYEAAILDVRRWWWQFVFQPGFVCPDVAPGAVGGGSLVFVGGFVADTERETAGGLGDTGYEAGQYTDDANA